VFAKNIGVDRGRVEIECFSQVKSVAHCVKESSRAEDPAELKAGYLGSFVSEDINRIGDDQNKAAGSVFFDFLADSLYYFTVCFGEVKPGFSGFLRATCGDNYQVGVFECIIVVGSGDLGRRVKMLSVFEVEFFCLGLFEVTAQEN